MEENNGYALLFRENLGTDVKKERCLQKIVTWTVQWALLHDRTGLIYMKGLKRYTDFEVIWSV
jgi:hypothetical protein